MNQGTCFWPPLDLCKAYCSVQTGFMITGTRGATFIGRECKKKLGRRFFQSGGTTAGSVAHKSTYVCLYMFLTWKSGASWPAQGSRGRKKKSRKPNICLYVHIISRSHDVYLYKSVKTPTCRGSIVCVKHESLGKTTCSWVGQKKYNRGDNMCKHGKGSVWSEDEARMVPLVRCCKG